MPLAGPAAMELEAGNQNFTAAFHGWECAERAFRAQPQDPPQPANCSSPQSCLPRSKPAMTARNSLRRGEARASTAPPPNVAALATLVLAAAAVGSSGGSGSPTPPTPPDVVADAKGDLDRLGVDEGRATGQRDAADPRGGGREGAQRAGEVLHVVPCCHVAGVAGLQLV